MVEAESISASNSLSALHTALIFIHPFSLSHRIRASFFFFGVSVQANQLRSFLLFFTFCTSVLSPFLFFSHKQCQVEDVTRCVCVRACFVKRRKGRTLIQMSNFKVGITVGGAAPYPQPPSGAFTAPKNGRGSFHKTNSILYKRQNSTATPPSTAAAATAGAGSMPHGAATAAAAAQSTDHAVRNATYPLTKNRAPEFAGAPLKPGHPASADSQPHGSSRPLHGTSSNTAVNSMASGGTGGTVDINRSAVTTSHVTSNSNSMNSVHMDFSPVSEDRNSAAAGNVGSGFKRTAWKCSLCGYFVLAMDQNGEPLPITLSAYRKPLPMCCPRCSVTHTMWEQACPFDAFGDYVTLRSRLSNTYVDRSASNRAAGDTSASSLRGRPDSLSEAQGAASQNGAVSPTADSGGATTPRHQQLHPLLPRVSSTVLATTPPPRTAEEEQAFRARAKHGGGNHDPRGDLPAILENIGKVSYRVGTTKPAPAVEPVAKQVRMMAYYCMHCGRKLMRMGPNGDLIPLATDTEGNTRPVTCPGCQRAHTDWEARPFTWTPEPRPA